MHPGQSILVNAHNILTNDALIGPTLSSKVTTDDTKNENANSKIVTASQVSSSDSADLKQDIDDLKVTPDPRENVNFIDSGIFTATY